MALTFIIILQYFLKDELKKALRDINEPLTGTRADLAKRVFKEWPEHDRILYDILHFLPKPVLSDICYDFSLDHTGNKETLKKRIVKAVEKNNSGRSQQIESKDFPEQITRKSSLSSSNKIKIIVGAVTGIVAVSTIAANFTTIWVFFETHLR